MHHLVYPGSPGSTARLTPLPSLPPSPGLRGRRLRVPRQAGSRRLSLPVVMWFAGRHGLARGQLISAVRPMGTRLHVRAASDDVNLVEVGGALTAGWAAVALLKPPAAVSTGGLDRARPSLWPDLARFHCFSTLRMQSCLDPAQAQKLRPAYAARFGGNSASCKQLRLWRAAGVACCVWVGGLVKPGDRTQRSRGIVGSRLAHATAAGCGT